MGAFAQFERELIKERQREGIALAKAKGNVYRGRVPSLTTEKAALLRGRVAAGEPKAKLARELVSVVLRSTTMLVQRPFDPLGQAGLLKASANTSRHHETNPRLNE
jgi:DNA invertase Pin-like site-specific DNA recombinase